MQVNQLTSLKPIKVATVGSRLVVVHGSVNPITVFSTITFNAVYKAQAGELRLASEDAASNGCGGAMFLGAPEIRLLYWIINAIPPCVVVEPAGDDVINLLPERWAEFQSCSHDIPTPDMIMGWHVGLMPVMLGVPGVYNLVRPIEFCAGKLADSVRVEMNVMIVLDVLDLLREPEWRERDQVDVSDQPSDVWFACNVKEFRPLKLRQERIFRHDFHLNNAAVRVIHFLVMISEIKADRINSEFLPINLGN